MEDRYFNKNIDANYNTTISLYDWINSDYDADMAREIFIYMSSALKYIHNKGYYVSSFYPTDIDILNGSFNQIRFKGIEKMPVDVVSKKDIVRSNIYSSAFLQIGIYSNCLDYLNSSFLKENFDKFSEFLPTDDIPYYRGVILNGYSVYFDDYVAERKKREFDSLKRTTGDVDGGYGAGKKLVKTNGVSLLEEVNRGVGNFDFSNDKVNNSIYKQLRSGLEDAAFISFLIIPTLVSVCAVLFAIMVLVMSL